MQQQFLVGDIHDCQALLLQHQQQLMAQLQTVHNTILEPTSAKLNLLSNGCLAEPALGCLLPLWPAAAVGSCLLLLLLVLVLGTAAACQWATAAAAIGRLVCQLQAGWEGQ
jgi:hypothetical protein